MDKENKNKKRKIKIKADIKADNKADNKLILKKDYLVTKKNNTLILSKTININEANKTTENRKNKLKVISSNIINLNKKNESNQNVRKVLQLSNISKSLGGKPILKDISFTVNKGQIFGMFGPNGAGKSTLLNTIIGKIFPDTGTIKLNNELINALPIHRRANKGISLLEQNKGLFGNMTGYENLYAILELHIEDKDKIETKIFQLLSYFGLQYLSDVKANNMSGGEYKKLATLQRICNREIRLLLLDEPLAALDPLSINSIKKFICELRDSGLSIIVTDHNFFALQDILDKCIIIRDGIVMVEGPPSKIIKDERAIKYYLGSSVRI